MAASLVIRRRSGSFWRSLSRFLSHDLRHQNAYALGTSKVLSSHQTAGMVICQQQRRAYSVEEKKEVKETSSKVDSDEKHAGQKKLPVLSAVYSDDEKERFIPITRISIVRHIMQEKNFLTEEEIKKYESFALALDSAIINRYHGLLHEIKNLFDPINPDKDTITTRTWNRRERLDNEFWLLHKLGNIMKKANFNELSKPVVEKALAEHSSQEGVMVSVDTDKYDVLRFWALGKNTPPQKIPFLLKIGNFIMRKPALKPLEFYKRVVVAVRLKKDDKLMLKAFKEVPINALEQLLPDGKIKMSQFDKTIIGSTLSIAGLGIMVKIVTTLAHMRMDWSLLLTAITGLIAVRAWTVYKNRRNAYLLELSRMLYFKNIANNRGLLTLLVDRAEDEIFKEVLLVYSFLMTNRPPSYYLDDTRKDFPVEQASMNVAELQRRIEEWVMKKTGSPVQFDSTEAVTLLKEFGILNEDYDQNMYVLPLEGAMRNLPVTPQTIAPRIEEYDIVEGYEREIPQELESEDDYKADAKKRKLFGWF